MIAFGVLIAIVSVRVTACRHPYPLLHCGLTHGGVHATNPVRGMAECGNTATKSRVVIQSQIPFGPHFKQVPAEPEDNATPEFN